MASSWWDDLLCRMPWRALGGAPMKSAVIDFTSVRSVSYSFADEFIGTLMQTTAVDDRPAIAAVEPLVARTIERSLQRRGIDPDGLLDRALTAA
jgi:anti-anti-sigma regulatory factor